MACILKEVGEKGVLCTGPTRFVRFLFIVLVYKNNIPWIYMSPHSDIIPSQSVCALSLSCCVLSGDPTHTNCIVFGLTRSGLEPTIYHTRGEHANHYTTDVVLVFKRGILLDVLILTLM